MDNKVVRFAGRMSEWWSGGTRDGWAMWSRHSECGSEKKSFLCNLPQLLTNELLALVRFKLFFNNAFIALFHMPTTCRKPCTFWLLRQLLLIASRLSWMWFFSHFLLPIGPNIPNTFSFASAPFHSLECHRFCGAAWSFLYWPSGGGCLALADQTEGNRTHDLQELLWSKHGGAGNVYWIPGAAH